jgi:YbbR domain-containing protein
VGSITSNPATVEIVGPESSLRGLTEAMTEPIPISNATRPIREVVTIGVADPTVRLRTPQTAEVTVQIVTGSTQRTLSDVPVQIRNLGNGLRARLLPATVSLTIRGTEQAIADLDADGLDVAVDASGLATGDHPGTVQVLTALGLTIERVEPPNVRLRITKQ